VDEERNYLYSYTVSNCSLSVYNLGPTGANQITLLGNIPSLPRAIGPLIPPSPSHHRFVAKETFGIVSLHVVPRSESRHVSLVAVTFQGLRIYLADGPSGGYINQGFRVVHVRFPPPDTEAENMGDVAASSYLNGGFLCAYGSDVAQDHNPVVGASVDLGKLIKAQAGVGPSGNQQNGQVSVHGQQMGNIYNPYPAPRPPLSEFHNTLSVSGRTWALKRMIKASSIVRYGNTNQSIYNNASTYPTALNALATQFTEPPDQFLVLTNISLTFVVRRRTSDVLRLILEMEAGSAMGGPPSPEGLTTFVDA
jgi:nuclear pore complex protein Nup155